MIKRLATLADTWHCIYGCGFSGSHVELEQHYASAH